MNHQLSDEKRRRGIFLGIMSLLLWSTVCQADPPLPPNLPPQRSAVQPIYPVPQIPIRLPTPPPPAPPGAMPEQAVAKELANYVVSVRWKDDKGATHLLQVLTTEGDFDLSTHTLGEAKINNSNIPIMVNLRCFLTVLSPEKGRLKFFLGRNVPYITGTTTGPNGLSTSSYQQLQAGLNSTFIVTFGKAHIIKSDGQEEVTVLVEREER